MFNMSSGDITSNKYLLVIYIFPMVIYIIHQFVKKWVMFIMPNNREYRIKAEE